MTWVIGTVTLPFAPSSVRMPKSADKEQVKPDAGEPVNIVTGTKTTVTLKGTISNPTLTAAQIVSTYIAPLYGLVGTQVAVTTTDGMIDGDWLLDTFDTSRDNPYPNWDYNIMLAVSYTHLRAHETDSY